MWFSLGRTGEAGSVRQALWRGRNIVRVHVVVPAGFDDPGQPTGGNIYDRRVCAGLAEAGWEVRVATVAAAWPVPDSGARADLARVVSAIPDGETVLIDGLIASPSRRAAAAAHRAAADDRAAAHAAGHRRRHAP